MPYIEIMATEDGYADVYLVNPNTSVCIKEHVWPAIAKEVANRIHIITGYPIYNN